MSERRIAVNRKDDSRSRKEWGDTRSGIPGRVVHVSKFPSYATVDDFVRFFETCGELEGVQIRDYHAFVQFSRPHGANFAISRSREKFLGKSIAISNYLERERPRRDERAHRVRDRSRSVSPIDPDWSPERRIAERKRQAREALEDKSRKSKRHRSESSSRVRDEVRSPAFRDQRAESRAELGREVEVSNSLEPSNSFLNPARIDALDPGALPVDVELTLRLVLEHKSARTLSLSQIDKILVYFKSEQHILTATGRTFVSRELPLQQFQMQPTTSTYIPHLRQHPPQQPLQQPTHSSPKEPPPKESNQSPKKSTEPSNDKSSDPVSTNKDPEEVPEYIKNFGRLLRKAVN